MNRARCARITTRISDWFKANARSLPWRRHPRSGYAALVSEAMLQQTQVARVVERYRAFMKRFPNVRTLARANEQSVLAMWQGLGYYRRAKHLHAAARMIVNECGGRVPRSVEQLRALPGVGRYTAGAIASIVYGQREPIVDGNVRRVLMRLFANESRTFRRDPAAWTWRRAAALVSHAAEPGSFNEGLMELGATVCVPLPAKPRCGECPLSRMCAARKLGVQERIPAKASRATAQSVHHHAVIVHNSRTGKVLLEQRPATGMWAGMWQVPTVEAVVRLTPAEVARMTGVPATILRRVRKFDYKTTHRAITFHVYEAESARKPGVWRDLRNLAGLALSNAQKRVLRCLSDK